MSMRSIFLCLAIIWSAGSLSGAVRVIPTPQYLEPEQKSVIVTHGGNVVIVLGPLNHATSEKMKVAAAFLQHDLEQAEPSLKIEIETGKSENKTGVQIHLWNYAIDPKPATDLNLLDHEALTSSGHYGQSYLVRTPDQNSLWIIGSTDDGVLLGAMTVLQLIEKTGAGVRIQGAYIRDYPDFRYRASADWLLMVEINGWALDWGQGMDAYKRLCERELDEALRFKINMVFFDGFGFGLRQRPGDYGELMRSLNRYARIRGIHLVFGGYGARYGMVDAKMKYFGEAWENKESYPNGSTYECMGSHLGTCRANEHLNHLKAEELRNFVRIVEPGALYIHHEDVGLDKFGPMWKKRDDRCRRRWPNDSVTAVDGAVGALTHLDSELIEAINSVKNPDGYDASKDCVIIMVSPGYGPDSISSSDWSDSLRFWVNYAKQLPPSANTLICFGGSSISSIFPQQYGGKSWIDAFNSLTAQTGIHIGSFVFVVGGAEHFYTDYPLTGTPALDAIYHGATAIFNGNGNFYQKPMEVINAEYSWNYHSTGFYRDPGSWDEVMHLNLTYMFAKNQPRELFGPNSIYERACALLYGPEAGAIMESYYRDFQWVPETTPEENEWKSLQWYMDHSALSMPLHYRERPFAGAVASEADQLSERPGVPEGDYLPVMWNRVYAIPEHGRDLAIDSKTWTQTIDDKYYSGQLAKLHIDTQELHRRLTRRWTILAELNTNGARDIDQALNADPLPRSIPGLQFLKVKCQVDHPLLEALADFHRGMQLYYAAPEDKAFRQPLQRALNEAKEAQELAAKAFPHPIDPIGGTQPYGPGEIAAIQTFSRLLVETINRRLQ
jgi:hypothetical protein